MLCILLAHWSLSIHLGFHMDQLYHSDGAQVIPYLLNKFLQSARVERLAIWMPKKSHEVLPVSEKLCIYR